MYQSLELFRTATAMARHAGARQALTARNIAHADTPGYRALEMPAFRDVYGQGPAHQVQMSRPGHMRVANSASAASMSETRSEPAPNGNSVSIEEEMLNAVAIGREHNRALAIYRHTMTVLRTTLGR
jgi:flagellar basal-body rod protein FlgB